MEFIMKELSTQKTMTVKELSEFIGKSEETIRRKAKELDIYAENGKTLRLNRKDVEDITVGLFRKLPIAVQSAISETFSKDKGSPLTNEKVEYITKEDLKDFARETVSEIMKAIIPLIQKPIQQIGYTQDYYSVLGYCNQNHLPITFSDMIRFGREASKISREKGIEIRKIPDERYGEVGSYHVDILAKIFEVK
jgi:hypothetical protein